MSSFPEWWTNWAEPHWKDERYRRALALLEAKSPEKREVRDWMLCRFGATPGHFVDIGTGTGSVPQGFVRCGWTVTLMDSDSHTVDVLKQSFPNPHRVLQVDVLSPDGVGTDLPKGDLVGLTHVLYHIPRPRWGEVFFFANSLRAEGGKMVIALRSPREYFNLKCAQLGADIFDVEKEAAKWAREAGVPIACHTLRMSHATMTVDDVVVLAQFLLRDMPEEQFSRPVPDLDELRRQIAADLFDGTQCTWPYENSLVVVG